MKLENPWKQNPWFESVAVAQQRARKRLPAPIYGALLAGSERGQTVSENEAAFRELGLAPHVAGNPASRSLATRVLGQDLSLPVLISLSMGKFGTSGPRRRGVSKIFRRIWI